MTRTLFFLIGLVCLFGCQTTSKGSDSVLTNRATYQDPEAVESLKSVAEAVSGQELSDEDLKRLAQDMQRDEEVRSALDAITNSVGGSSIVIKYCPIDGKRYSSDKQFCPGTDVPLEILE